MRKALPFLALTVCCFAAEPAQAQSIQRVKLFNNRNHAQEFATRTKGTCTRDVDNHNLYVVVYKTTLVVTDIENPVPDLSSHVYLTE